MSENNIENMDPAQAYRNTMNLFMSLYNHKEQKYKTFITKKGRVVRVKTQQ